MFFVKKKRTLTFSNLTKYLIETSILCFSCCNFFYSARAKLMDANFDRSQVEKSTISWCRPPLLWWNELDPHKVALMTCVFMYASIFFIFYRAHGRQFWQCHADHKDEKSTISWCGPPLLWGNKLDPHQVALPLLFLLVVLNKLNVHIIKPLLKSKISRYAPMKCVFKCMNHLPLVKLTGRVLVAFLRAGWHSFNPLQFLNGLKNRNSILLGTIYIRNGRQNQV